MNGLTLREQRLVAIGLLVLVAALVWLAVASPILQGFAARREAQATAQADLARNARLISSFPTLRSEAQAQARSAEVYAWSASTPLAAGEMARGRIARAVVEQGGVLQALRSQAAPARQVRLQADLRIGLSGLAELIRRLENDRPYASVNALSIAASDTAAAGRLSPLEVRLDVSYSYAGWR